MSESVGYFKLVSKPVALYTKHTERQRLRASSKPDKEVSILTKNNMDPIEPPDGCEIKYYPLSNSYHSMKKGPLNRLLKPDHGEFRWFYRTGVLAHDGSYRDNKKDGVYRWFDKSGHLKMQTTYKNNEQHGEHKLFYPSGKPKLISKWVDGKRHGLKTELTESGKLQYQRLWLNGKEQSESKTIESIQIFQIKL